MVISLLLLLAACNPTACVEVPVGDPTQDGDGSAVGDSGGPDDSGPVDTGPPPPCDVPEVEPNSPYSNAQDLPMEQWACGVFSDPDDLTEIFYFENDRAGWLRVWGRAFEIGSLADLTLTVAATDGPYAATRLGNPTSTDTDLIFPVDDDYGFYVTLSETYTRSGDSYRWELMASEVKAPVKWTSEEGSDNDSATRAEPITSGDRRLAFMNSTTDIDWYAIELPEGGAPVTIDVDAWYYGSPADVRAEFYEPDATTLFRAASGSTTNGANDLDPHLEPSPTEGGTWYVKVIPDSSGGGGAAYWYVIEVDIEE
ncbi:MAG: hypothetical protein D6798_10620 [Deltaproteobacteria bacterium]|nr:MAG: hypothetical protein D6798_10620 [Deltaproteobacteria bacterium]